jgi:hypothetical protein
VIKFIFIIFLLAFAGCAINSIPPEVARVELLNENANFDNCIFKEEVLVSRRSYDEILLIEELHIATRNELRNSAYNLGGNVVHLIDMDKFVAFVAPGTGFGTAVVGKVYKCSK